MRVFFVVGEESGDLLGGELIEALHAHHPGAVEVAGAGGERMVAQGLEPLFPLSDISVMGLTAVIARLPTIIRRISDCVTAIREFRPDVVVIIDSPDFTHRVAKRVRKLMPELPIIGYVSPSVWVWRPGRAKKMARYVDHLLAILPFEPEVHKRLDGPPCSYVGHPLLTKLERLRPKAGEREDFSSAEKPVLLILPGSRGSETSRLLEPFAKTLEIISRKFPDLELLLPAVAHLEDDIRKAVDMWPVRPKILIGEKEKLSAFRRAHAALAASGTVTLELALAGVPMVVAYKVDFIYGSLRKITGITPVFSLPNIILDGPIVPELVQENATPEIMAKALAPLLTDGPERARQLQAFEKLDDIMRLHDGDRPADKAAEIVSRYAAEGRKGSAE